MNTECDEVADSMRAQAPRFSCFDDALRYVRGQMPDQGTTIVDNVAWALWRSQPGEVST